MPRNPSCERCILSKGTTHVCLWGEGSAQTGGVMLLGEAPGAQEEQTGRPFIGDAGVALNGYLRAIGRQRTDPELYVTNTCKCRPPGNREPSKEEAAACFPYLAEEIAARQPAVILCLGGAALKTLTGLTAVGANRGRALAPRKGVRVGDAEIWVTYHPAATMHNRNTQEQERIKGAITEDLRRAFERSTPMPLGSEEKPASKDRRLLLDEASGYSLSLFQQALKSFERYKVLACDLEWTALPDRKISWPWSRGAEAFSVALTGRDNDGTYKTLSFSWPPPEGGVDALQSLFDKVPLFFHNAMADMIWLAALNIRVRLAGDTILWAYLLDEEQNLNLEDVTHKYTDIKTAWKIGPWASKPWTKEGWAQLLNYNGDDTYATFKLMLALLAVVESRPEREKRGLKRIYQELLLKSIPVLVQAALTGAPMNPDIVHRELLKSVERSNEIASTLAGMIGCRPDQAAAMAGSPDATTKYLRDAYGLDIDGSSKDDLLGLEDAAPPIPYIQKYRWEKNKVQGTYLGKWERLLIEQGDRRLHSVYRETASRTGRLSAEIELGGSLTLAPREQYVREGFEEEDGWLLGAADYSQIEMRVMAWFAKERTMLALFNEKSPRWPHGVDLHSMTAAYVKACQAGYMPLDVFMQDRDYHIDLITRPDRQNAKGINFGFLYGMQADSFVPYAKQTYKVDFTLEQAYAARKAYFALYGDLQAYHDYCERVLYPQGYTQTPFGRMRRNIEDARKAINTPIQATASDMTLYAMIQVYHRFIREGMRSAVCGFIHDSIMWRSPDGEMDYAKEIVKWEMENVDLTLLGVEEIPVPLVADVASGRSWADCK